jgi:hypothetical protein
MIKLNGLAVKFGAGILPAFTQFVAKCGFGKGIAHSLFEPGKSFLSAQFNKSVFHAIKICFRHFISPCLFFKNYNYKNIKVQII